MVDNPIFEEMFDNDVLKSTLFRNTSMNMLALKKYGTIEIRRMHATLDEEFMIAWAEFCVGFVELFSQQPSQVQPCCVPAFVAPQ